jgi:hypothetical protein
MIYGNGIQGIIYGKCYCEGVWPCIYKIKHYGSQINQNILALIPRYHIYTQQPTKSTYITHNKTFSNNLYTSN